MPTKGRGGPGREMRWLPAHPPMPAGDLDPAAQAEMQPGETLLWTARCTVWQNWTKAAWPLWVLAPAAFCWLATLLWFCIAPHLSLSRSPWDTPLVPLSIFASMTCVGVLGVAHQDPAGDLRAMVAAFRDRNVLFAISDRRVLERKGSAPKFRSYHDVDPLAVEAVADQNGRGDLFFTYHDSEAPRRPENRSGMRGIPCVREVERLLIWTLLHKHDHGGPFPSVSSIPDRVRRGLSDRRRRALAIARMLRMQPPSLEEVVAHLDGNADTLKALSVLGIWRPIGATGATMVARGLRGSATERAAAIQALGRLSRPAVVSLIEARATVPSDQILAVNDALERIPDDLLAGALADTLLEGGLAAGASVAADVGVPRRLRRRVIEEWKRTRPPACERLLALTREGEERARSWAAEALGRMATGEARERLRDAAAGMDAVEFPVAVLRAHLGDPSGAHVLLARLSHSDEDARQVAAQAIGQLGASGAPFLGAMEDLPVREWDPETRSLVEAAIGRIRASVRVAPVELEAANAPAGRGDELEAGPAAADLRERADTH